MGQRRVGHLWHRSGTADTGCVGGGGAGSWGPRVGQGGKVWQNRILDGKRDDIS